MTLLNNIFKFIRSGRDNSLSDKTTLIDSYLDMNFINVLYFKDAESKIEYIEKIKNILLLTVDNNKIDRPRVSEYLRNSEADIPFLMDAIKFDELDDKFKFEKYYTALGVCRYNIQSKIKTNVFDFDFEEKLAEKALESDNRNYARIETLFLIGQAFFMTKNFIKMDFYFNIIYNDTYELSEVTVSNFFRQIGEIYLESGKKSVALNWYNSGLQLNPKLGVKKQIVSLEKELNGS